MARVLVAIAPGELPGVAEALARTGARMTRANTAPDVQELARATGFDLMLVDEDVLNDDQRFTLSRRQPNARLWLLTDDVMTPALQRHADFVLLKPVDTVVLWAKFEHHFAHARVQDPR